MRSFASFSSVWVQGKPAVLDPCLSPIQYNFILLYPKNKRNTAYVRILLITNEPYPNETVYLYVFELGPSLMQHEPAMQSPAYIFKMKKKKKTI